MNRGIVYGNDRKKNALKKILNMPVKPVWFVIVNDLMLLAVSLLVFALFHHVIPYAKKSLGIQTAKNMMAPAAEGTVTDTVPETAETAVSVKASEDHSVPGDFSALYPDKFTAVSRTVTDTTLQSPNLNISISEYYTEPSGGKAGQRYYAADFYIRNINCLQTAFSKDTFGRNITASIASTVYDHNSVLTMNGDFYGLLEGGICIRNGIVYSSDEVVRDICVLYWDGTVDCYKPEEYDTDTVIAQGAFQCWNFGPALLDENGAPRQDYASINEDIYGNQPRAAFGYYAPGHYCFIACDGRSDNSRGFTIDQLAELAQRLDLKQCYNMDGGKTAELAFGTSMVNVPANGGRNCSDYICVIDSDAA